MLESTTLRFGIFIAVLLLMIMAERLWPRRELLFARASRWRTNLGLVVLNSMLLKLLGPVTAVVAASWATSNGWGLLAMLPLPLPIDLVLGVVLLDLAIYFQHRVFHHVPLLWNIHRVHHCDRDIDATTGLRFHPIEIVLSMLYKCVIVLLLGPLVVSVIAFEIILNASAMFNHANLRLPKKLDGLLRQIVVTPDMHRVHHSVEREETDSNFGFCLSWWDRLFGTYRDQPRAGHSGMTIGLQEFQTEQPASFIWSLKLPILRSVAGR